MKNICFNEKPRLERLYGRRSRIGTLFFVRFFFGVHFLFGPSQPFFEKTVEPGELFSQNHEPGDQENPARHDGKDEADDAEEDKTDAGNITEEFLHFLYYDRRGERAQRTST